MTLPTSFDAAYEAVVEALTTDTGRTRALTPEHLFKRIASTRSDGDLEAQVLKHRKVALVVLRDLVPHVGSEMQPTDRLSYDGFFDLVLLHHSGNDLFAEEMDRARKQAVNDIHRIRAALCFPGVLATNAAGTEAGIDGDQLTSRGAVSRGPEHVQGRGFLRSTLIFPVTITLRVE